MNCAGSSVNNTHDVGHPFVALGRGKAMCLPCYAYHYGRDALRIFTGVTRPCEAPR